jgi:transposase
LADIAANTRRGKNAGLFDIERGINGLAADERLGIRKEQSVPLLTALEAWLIFVEPGALGGGVGMALI